MAAILHPGIFSQPTTTLSILKEINKTKYKDFYLTTAGTEATAGMKATTQYGRQHSMDAIKSRDALKTLKQATANSSRDNRNITASAAGGRPATTRIPELVETGQQQYKH